MAFIVLWIISVSFPTLLRLRDTLFSSCKGTRSLLWQVPLRLFISSLSVEKTLQGKTTVLTIGCCQLKFSFHINSSKWKVFHKKSYYKENIFLMSLLRHNSIEKTLLNCMHWIKKSQLQPQVSDFAIKPRHRPRRTHSLTILFFFASVAHVRNSIPKRKLTERLINDRGTNSEFAWRLSALSFTVAIHKPCLGPGSRATGSAPGQGGGKWAERQREHLRAITRPAALSLSCLCRRPFLFSSHHVGWDQALCAGSQNSPNIWRIFKKKKN